MVYSAGFIDVLMGKEKPCGQSSVSSFWPSYDPCVIFFFKRGEKWNEGLCWDNREAAGLLYREKRRRNKKKEEEAGKIWSKGISILFVGGEGAEESQRGDVWRNRWESEGQRKNFWRHAEGNAGLKILPGRLEIDFGRSTRWKGSLERDLEVCWTQRHRAA